MVRFQCPECGFGDHEVGHLIAEIEIYCVVCLEEDGRLIRLALLGGRDGSRPLARRLGRRLSRGPLRRSFLLGGVGFSSSATWP